MTFDEAVSYIFSLPSDPGELKANSAALMLDFLGRPDEDMCIVHVAGTNGKGSVCAYMESVFRSQGMKTALFTSPHLVSILERFQIDRRNVSPEAFMEAFYTVERAAAEMRKDGYAHPRIFDTLFLIAMVLFHKERPDVVILETGIGGRLDATTAARNPSLCVITSIGFDHMDRLGNTIGEIAGEKAGIICEGVPVVFDASGPEAAEVIRQAAIRKKAPFMAVDTGNIEILSHGRDHLIFTPCAGYFEGRPVTVPFPADYQAQNAYLALSALKVWDTEQKIKDGTILSGIAGTFWQGRMEEIRPGVVLDGAHNKDGALAVAEWAGRVSQTKRLTLLFGALAEKQIEEMVRVLMQRVPWAHVTVTSAGSSRAADPDDMARMIRRFYEGPLTVEADTAKALKEAEENRKDGILLCTGSLYLIGLVTGILAYSP